MLITPKKAFEQKLRDIYLEAEGSVAEILPDDTTGVPHQRFIILTETGQTLLIVHNIDYGNQIEIYIGNKIKATGTYVWNRHGGLIHQTHQGTKTVAPTGQIKIISKKSLGD